jgi:SAM-dependent methyltransferase
MGTFLICSKWGQGSIRVTPVTMPPMDDIHPAAARGFEAGTDAYVRGRPEFPRAALDWLHHDLGLGAGKIAIDLGAGTGKFTRLLTQTGADVIAVEPVRAMRQRLSRDLPTVNALAGRAQQIPLAATTANAVICAQAFHWFANKESLAEIHRVLKPGGILGLIWNVRDESVGWVAALTRIMAPYESDAPRYYKDEWRRAFPAPGFGSLAERTFLHAHVGAPEHVIVDRVASVSFIAALDAATRKRVLDDVRGLIAATPELADRCEVSMPYVTRAYCCRKDDE